MNVRLRCTVWLLLLLAGIGFVRAGSDVNEVGAILVFPVIVGVPGQETLVTFTNAGASEITAHVAYINGDPTPIADGGAGYCYECNFDIPMTGFDTETLVISQTPNGIAIQSEDNALSMSCPYPFGMIVVNVENASGETQTDNILLGEEVVIDYASGSAYSIPAIPFQGGSGGDGDRSFGFNDQEYGKLPRIVASDFLAPTLPQDPRQVTADLALFTLGFDRQFPPTVDCNVAGYDAVENVFSSSFLFGCWTMVGLCDISPEFCYPNLGLFGTLDSHGWLALDCSVDQDGDGTVDADGGVHGALMQTAETGAALRPNEPGALVMSARSAWSRLLFQSVTTGDAVTLHLGGPQGGLF